ncbi:hypothetical protein N7501_000464 [Penicillium viridicatum]|nr:hypothetical protein N7501_000464 [Penicillium viridicatum]
MLWLSLLGLQFPRSMEASLYINTLVGEGSLGDIVGITVFRVQGALTCTPGLFFVMLANVPDYLGC